MTAESRCSGCERRCACDCGCQRHSHFRHCLECSQEEHREVVWRLPLIARVGLLHSG